MVGGGRSHGLEEGASLFKRLDVCRVVMNVYIGGGAELLDLRAPVRAIDLHNGIRPKCRDDPPAPAGVANGLMMGQGIGRGVRRRQDFNVEALE